MDRQTILIAMMRGHGFNTAAAEVKQRPFMFDIDACLQAWINYGNQDSMRRAMAKAKKPASKRKAKQ